MTSPTPQPPEPTQQDLTRARTAKLDRLSDIGMMLAENLATISNTSPETRTETGAKDLAQAFDKLARAIRRTIALAERLPLPIRAQPGPQRINLRAARAALIRKVEDHIDRDSPYGEADSLRDELYERLDDPELDHDLETRPLHDVAHEWICDLGINQSIEGVAPTTRRTPADIRALRARAAKTATPDPRAQHATRGAHAEEPGSAEPIDAPGLDTQAAPPDGSPNSAAPANPTPANPTPGPRPENPPDPPD